METQAMSMSRKNWIAYFESANKDLNVLSFHKSIPGRIITRESSQIEFKTSFNWGSKDMYGKTIAAFANNRGGLIVFGVKDQPRDLIGLQSNNFEYTDEAKITTYLNDVFSPELEYEKNVIEIKGKRVGIIRIYESREKPVICSKNAGVLKESDIYYRYNAKSEKIKYPELKQIFDCIREKERTQWMKLFQETAKIGLDKVGILDINAGTISGVGAPLLLDDKLISQIKFVKEGHFQEDGGPALKLVGEVKPVSVVVSNEKQDSSEEVKIKITNDPDAPEVKISEEDFSKHYPLTYKTLSDECRKRYSDFKADKKYHELRKGLKNQDRFCLTRYIDPRNQKSTKQDFFSRAIITEFDKHYILRTKRTSAKEAQPVSMPAERRAT